jgi:hypothetical protein
MGGAAATDVADRSQHLRAGADEQLEALPDVVHVQWTWGGTATTSTAPREACGGAARSRLAGLSRSVSGTYGAHLSRAEGRHGTTGGACVGQLGITWTEAAMVVASTVTIYLTFIVFVRVVGSAVSPAWPGSTSAAPSRSDR